MHSFREYRELFMNRLPEAVAAKDDQTGSF
jgi:hypothetical protein